MAASYTVLARNLRHHVAWTSRKRARQHIECTCTNDMCTRLGSLEPVVALLEGLHLIEAPELILQQQLQRVLDGHLHVGWFGLNTHTGFNARIGPMCGMSVHSMVIV